MNNSLNKVVAVPAITRWQLNNEQDEVNEANENQEVVEIPLMKCPRTLAILWTEFEFGIDGNKPAKYFTAKERGVVQFAYCLRKPFWLLIQKLIRHRHTHLTAISELERVYMGNRRPSVTMVLGQIKSDAGSGGHPQLQYN